MERAAGLYARRLPAVRLDKLDALLAQSSTSSQDAALFAELLSLPNDGRYPAVNLAETSGRNAGGVRLRNWKSCRAFGQC